ncbi:hypothetical protein SISNIDRAFT_396314, partial [Sistotremastrum niveocremeum HHB9708]
RIALDILPRQATSVASERLFSSVKLTAADNRSRLGCELFEKIQILKSVWKKEVDDWAAINSEL